MFNKILIANRGEIALRILRSCKELGIKTVAVHSKADSEALHVKLSDESVCIGPDNPKDSYLNMVALLSAAEVTGSDAIHPGYGFLSERHEFADLCERCGIVFIGPRPDAMKKMGNKLEARETMKNQNIPILPGTSTPIQTVDEALSFCKEIHYPVILKAAAGGGGRGMKIITNEKELIHALPKAQSEALAAFGNSDIYIEKYCESPRHIEVQILGDNYGNIVHLGERDCTIQRRHQKLIEESPSPVLDDAKRKKIGETAVNVAKAVNYNNVGTVEFLYEGGHFYFMEMNTRIQVEHPVTEMITGLDIVKEQIRISCGEKLNLQQDDITFKGHSMECRINAEDPETFSPSPGRVTAYHPPGGLGVRIESALYNQYFILPYYDSLIAKLIIHANSRDEAIKKMKMALDEYVIDGVKTSIPLYEKIMRDPVFINGKYSTSYIAKFLHMNGGE